MRRLRPEPGRVQCAPKAPWDARLRPVDREARPSLHGERSCPILEHGAPCWRSAASGAASAPRAARGGCRRRQRTWWTVSPARAGAPVGASLSTSAADPAARVAGRAARAGHAGAAGGAAGGRTASAGPHGAQERQRSGRCGHADPALRLGSQPQYSPALPGAGRRGWSRRWGRPGWPSRMPTARRRARCGRCRRRPSACRPIPREATARQRLCADIDGF